MFGADFIGSPVDEEAGDPVIRNHPATHREARNDMWAWVGIGLVANVTGTVALAMGVQGVWAWLLIPLIILGIAAIFLAVIWFYTYLENLEEDRYFPANEDVPPHG